MNSNKSKNEYQKYHSDREDTRLGLFEALNQNYKISNVLYPGCYVHITPSFIFPRVTYIDTMKSAKTFFEGKDIGEIINQNKQYHSESEFRFIQGDYSKISEDIGKYDLLISQYAGFITQACKPYIKENAIAVVNNSHGDASMAYLDKDFTLIGVYNRRSDTKYVISTEKLEQYFVPKKGEHPNQEAIKKLQKGIGYTKSPSGYIFRFRKYLVIN